MPAPGRAAPVRNASATAFVLFLAALPAGSGVAQQGPEPADGGGYLVRAGTMSGLPVVAPNDNKVPAGSVGDDGVREVALEVVRADWRVESPAGPGLRVAAVAEAGGPPRVPAPLIRVEAGTRLRVRVRNRLDDEVSVFGLYERPAVEAPAPVVVAPGAEEIVELEAGEPGTYLYRMREGPEREPDPEGPFLERSQLAGAFVVDPPGGAAPDRVMVINIFANPVDTAITPTGSVEALTMNGLSWPFTERFRFAVGDSALWRVVNASERLHPMHLHGFFYEVLSRGTEAADTLYEPRSRRLVVTEPMRGLTTMLMRWSPTRPGHWLFHCHLSFHVAPHIRLPGAVEADHEHPEAHMAGLAVGIEVAPGPTDLVARGETERVDLYANEYGNQDGFRYGFALEPDPAPDSLTEAPGPPLVFHQYQAADITVHNRLSVPTGVHWHGLELEAWADGVPGWSRSDGKVSPVVPPGEAFTYRLHLMRPGTFIYHSHLDDVHQLTGGLYGPLIVLPPGETFDPRTDHVMTFGWNTPGPEGMADVDLNGRREQPVGRAAVGERHRFRVINIAPAGFLTAWLTRDGEAVPVTLHAKDGADLPAHQRVPVDSLPRLGAGETADFTWTPAEPGTYEVRIGYAPVPEAHLVQRWIVREGELPSGQRFLRPPRLPRSFTLLPS